MNNDYIYTCIFAYIYMYMYIRVRRLFVITALAFSSFYGLKDHPSQNRRIAECTCIFAYAIYIGMRMNTMYMYNVYIVFGLDFFSISCVSVAYLNMHTYIYIYIHGRHRLQTGGAYEDTYLSV